MNIWGIINIILIIIILAIGGSWLWIKIETKRVGGAITNEEFEKGKRKAQIIDVREKNTFKKKHILGARNIPMTMFKYQYSEIRPDLPVYIYSDAPSVSLRAVKLLKKNGYQKVFWLKDGFEGWKGQTKASKY